MRGKTHFLTGSLITATVAAVTMKDMSFIPYIVGGTSALLPDLDVEKSLLPNVVFNALSKKVKVLKIFRNSDIFRKFFITAIMAIGASIALKLDNIYIALACAYLGVYPYTKHRTLSHSILSLVILVGLTAVGMPHSNIPKYIAIGYTVHLIEDTLTTTGVPYLYPFIKTRQKLPLMSTGSYKEYIVIFITLIAWLANALKDTL